MNHNIKFNNKNSHCVLCDKARVVHTSGIEGRSVKHV